MSTKRSVLVTGATGQQGGVVARALLSRGHRVKALTRKPDSDAARQLMSAGADLVTGDLGNAASVLKAASGVDTVFLMGNSNEASTEEETRQGIIAAEAAKDAGVGHLIYSSVADADKKTGMAKERDDKIATIKSMEREINNFRQTREQQLQEQLMRMREGIVKEITEVVVERVKAKSLDFVLDKSGVSINGVPVVLYAPDNVDFTNEIIETLNKPGRATASTRKPAAAPSVSPAAARAAAADPT